MPFIDYYAILEVPRNATQEQIKRAYRRLARLYHPDVNQQVHDQRIKQLNEAYSVLGDVAKRAWYDIQILEEMRMMLIREAIRRQQERMEQARREARMTWTEGMVGFVRELRKGMRD